ncbi:hypothetical protein KEM56_002650 [Ascosphaera pollenicola]|nr:hypothetical protein KEM56_002650 [Ascosphaera pollenicola]
MSGVFNNLFGGGNKHQTPSPVGADSGFDDFDVKPIISTASASLASGASAAASAAAPSLTAGVGEVSGKTVPYTKWYRIWERTTPSDFIIEAVFIPAILCVCLFHVLGMRRNRRRARTFAQAHLPILQDEYALVGYGRSRRTQPARLSAQEIEQGNIPSIVLKESAANNFSMYATGRQNVAFLDIDIVTTKWYNPFIQICNFVLSYVFESVERPMERALLVAYAFDGREKELVPALQPDKEEIERKAKKESSVYDGFVFAIVHKNAMRKLREERYDISLTQTKDSDKLPQWATVMSESAEITDALLTKDLVQAVEEAGENNFQVTSSRRVSPLQ